MHPTSLPPRPAAAPGATSICTILISNRPNSMGPFFLLVKSCESSCPLPLKPRWAPFSTTAKKPSPSAPSSLNSDIHNLPHQYKSTIQRLSRLPIVSANKYVPKPSTCASTGSKTASIKNNFTYFGPQGPTTWVITTPSITPSTITRTCVLSSCIHLTNYSESTLCEGVLIRVPIRDSPSPRSRPLQSRIQIR